DFVAPTGVAAGMAGPAVFAAMNTFFINAGTPQVPVAPSVTSDGGGQFYQNQWQIPPSSSSWVVGEIIPVNNTTIQDTGAVTATANPAGSVVPFTYSSYGVIVFAGQVDGPIGQASSSSGLTVTTASGDIAFDYWVGNNQPVTSLTVWAGVDLTTTELAASAQPWTTQPGPAEADLPFGVVGQAGPTVGQIQLAANTVNLEPVATPYMVNLEQIFNRSVGKNNDNSPFFGSSGNLLAFTDNIEMLTTSGSMLLQGAIIDENWKSIGDIWPGYVSILSTDGNIYFDAYDYAGFNGIFTGVTGPTPLKLTSSGPPTIQANGADGDANNPITLDNNFVINVDGAIPTDSIIVSGAGGPTSNYDYSILPGSIIIPSNVMTAVPTGPGLISPIAPISTDG
ncbi:MAG TPA: hypothetical protein VKJ65_06575, partial [Phycisphaerae bacterium]|nr:hypothetical protein [Phycisphaerae bacterium]